MPSKPGHQSRQLFRELYEFLVFPMPSAFSSPLVYICKHIYIYHWYSGILIAPFWPMSVNYLIRINIENSIFYDVFPLVYCSFVALSYRITCPCHGHRIPRPKNHRICQRHCVLIFHTSVAKKNNIRRVCIEFKSFMKIPMNKLSERWQTAGFVNNGYVLG